MISFSLCLFLCLSVSLPLSLAPLCRNLRALLNPCRAIEPATTTPRSFPHSCFLTKGLSRRNPATPVHLTWIQGTPFQRVEDAKWKDKVGMFSEKDNSYEARFGEGGYGAKANQKLRTVRGKDFRHEKTKKKRGTYRGGTIDTAGGKSFKFNL